MRGTDLDEVLFGNSYVLREHDKDGKLISERRLDPRDVEFSLVDTLKVRTADAASACPPPDQLTAATFLCPKCRQFHRRPDVTTASRDG
jgi:hypothetical protein